MPTGKTVSRKKNGNLHPFLKNSAQVVMQNRIEKQKLGLKKWFMLNPALALLFPLMNGIHGIFSQISRLTLHLRSTRRTDTISFQVDSTTDFKLQILLKTPTGCIPKHHYLQTFQGSLSSTAFSLNSNHIKVIAIIKSNFTYDELSHDPANKSTE